jgi:hypothetical protein
MNNFDLIKFLAEGKLTANSKALNEDKLPTIKISKDIYYFDKLDRLDTKDNVDEKYHDKANLVFKKGQTVKDDTKYEDSDYKMITSSTSLEKGIDYLAEGKEKSSKMKMSELKKKIRQEILAELTLSEDSEVDLNISDPDPEYDPLAEAAKDKDGKVPSKDANTDIDIEDEVDIDVEEKPKADVDGDFLDQLEDLKDEADAIGDNKLERQVDNTITYFTRQHIAKDTNESLELEENLTKDQIQKKYNEMFGKNPQTKFADVAKALNTTEQEIAAALFSLPMLEADKDYYDAAERDDAAHIAALEKDMKDDKRSSMNESLEILKMKKLAGLLTEGEYAKALLREMEETTEGIEVEWAKDKLKDIFMTDKYYEKGLLDASSMMDGKKVKEIVGYFDDENGNEEVETIGYVYSTSGDIDKISQDTLDDAFYNSLISTKKSYRTGLRENQVNNKYVVKDEKLSDEDYGFYYIDQQKAFDYLKQFNNSEISAKQFIKDDEGWGEFEQYINNIEQMSDKELEDAMRQEMSYYFFSKPDEI